MVDRKNATRPFHKRIAVAFDFDRTLSDGTVDALLAELGVDDAMAWRHEQLAPMVADGWDEILAKGLLLARTAQACGRTITRDLLAEVGSRLKGYDGLDGAMKSLRAIGRNVADADVELYILSSGFVDMITASPIAPLFDGIWGSSLHWDEEGELAGVKRALIHSEKERYLLALAKGLDIAGANAPQDVFQDKPDEEWHDPLDQMLYVGDGASDIAAFKLVQKNGGIALAVDHSRDDEQWEASKHMFHAARVENLAPPDFSEGSEMRRSLELAVNILAHRVALRALAVGE